MREEGAYRIKVHDLWIKATWGVTAVVNDDGYEFEFWGFKLFDTGGTLSPFDVQEVDEHNLLLPNQTK